MIELCSKKRMLASVICLGGLTLIVLVFESHWAFEASAYTSRGNYSHLDKNATENCWLREKFSVAEACHPCTDFEVTSKSVKACVETHYKEGVKCYPSGRFEYRSCDKVEWLEERKFWQFEAIAFVLSISSSACVFLRQKVLDHKHLRALQRRLANSV